MIFQKQIYKCNVCGNIVEILHAGGGELVCCGKPMELLKEKTKDDGFEKHVPMVEKKDGGIIIKVGSIPHPMEKEHYIEWIEVISEDIIYRKHLTSNDKPEAEFNLLDKKIEIRIYCNLHGLWGKTAVDDSL